MISRGSWGQYFSRMSGICSCSTLQTQMACGVSRSMSMAGASTLPSRNTFSTSTCAMWSHISPRKRPQSSIRSRTASFSSSDNSSKSSCCSLSLRWLSCCCSWQVSLSQACLRLWSATRVRSSISLYILSCLSCSFWRNRCRTSFSSCSPPCFHAAASALSSSLTGLSSRNRSAWAALMVSLRQLGTDRVKAVPCSERTVTSPITRANYEQKDSSYAKSWLLLRSRQVSDLARVRSARMEAQVASLLCASLRWLRLASGATSCSWMFSMRLWVRSREQRRVRAVSPVRCAMRLQARLRVVRAGRQWRLAMAWMALLLRKRVWRRAKGARLSISLKPQCCRCRDSFSSRLSKPSWLRRQISRLASVILTNSSSPTSHGLRFISQNQNDLNAQALFAFRLSGCAADESLREGGVVELDEVREGINDWPAALEFDAQVVAVHGDPEEAALAPVGAVAVPADPELHAVLLAPAHHRDLVVFVQDQLRLRVDTACVVLPSVGSVDPAGDWSTRVDLSLHALCSLHQSVLNHLPHGVPFGGHAATGAALVADLFVGTEELFGVLGSVGLAALLGQADFPTVHVDVAWVAAIATAAVLAVDDDLRGDGEVWPHAFAGNIQAIGNHTGGGLDPAGSTVVRRPLVLGPGEVVDS